VARRVKKEPHRAKGWRVRSVVVTGGLGLTGSWVVHRLAAEGKHVIILDRERSHKDYLDGLLFEVLGENRNEIEGIIRLAGEDHQWPYAFVEANVMGLANLLEAARLNGIRKVVMQSSDAIYGRREGVLDETAPCDPVDLYGASIFAAELIGLQYAKDSQILLRIVRTGPVFGPGEIPRPGGLFSPLAGEPAIEMDSGWDDRRDLTYVKDAAKGIVMAYNADGGRHQVFNVSGGATYSTEDIVEAVKGHCAGPVKVKIGGGTSSPRFESGSPLDLTRAETALGYTPDYDLESGLAEYARWLKTRSAPPVGAPT